jgi:hypothetical protein
MQLALKRCKQCVHYLFPYSVIMSICHSFELGGEKKTKGAALTFVSVLSLLAMDVLNGLGIDLVTICLTPLFSTWPSLL